MSFFKNWFGMDKGEDGRCIIMPLIQEYAYKELALQTAINLISNTIAGCEFKTFRAGKEIKSKDYYMLNVSPNPNQSGKEFIKQYVSYLLLYNEVLIIKNKGHLYVADSFSRVLEGMNEAIYHNVTVNSFTYNEVFREKDVIYIKLNNENIKNIVESVYRSYGTMLSSAISSYKRSNAKRVTLSGEGLRAQGDEEQKEYDDMFNEQLKAWLSADNVGSVLTLQNELKLEDFTTVGKDSRDIKAIIDDFNNMVSSAFLIPKGLLTGEVAGVNEIVDSFLMFCIKPLVAIIEAPFNRKMYTEGEYLEKTYIRIETTDIKVISIRDFAIAMDKLFSIGGTSVNDIIERLGGEKIEEEWANARWITKNYQRAEVRYAAKENEKEEGDSN